MKKITLLLALCGMLTLNAQVTTGTLTFISGYTGEIVIDATNVTITLVGPEDLWLGVGFGVNTMTNGGDVVTHDASGFNDRQFLGVGTPPTLDTQDWTVSSNDVNGGVRILVVTRPVMGTDSADFVFDETASSINLVWARGNNTDTFGIHATNATGRGSVVAQLNPVLGIEDQTLANRLSIFPVPASDLVTVSIDNYVAESGSLEIYSMIGQLVQTEIISHRSTIIDISKLSAGIYLLNLSSNSGFASTKIVKK